MKGRVFSLSSYYIVLLIEKSVKKIQYLNLYISPLHCLVKKRPSSTHKTLNEFSP